MKIRVFREEDASEVSSLIVKNLIEVNSRDYPQDIITTQISKFSPDRMIEKAKSRIVIVAEDNGRILGTATLNRNKAMTVYVDPELHGKGIGTSLMEHIENIARERNLETLELYSSITAFEFYKKLGYKKVKDLQDEESGKSTLMVKAL